MHTYEQIRALGVCISFPWMAQGFCYPVFMKRAGFSLVELAIVLVILGLLTGGILAGRSLIRASELRAVAQELTQYRTAAYAFRDKYLALPGDVTNATSFWGTASACPGDESTPATDSNTCNGDGDGQVNISTHANEYFRFWQHLANAGLIEGQYTGVRNSGSGGNMNRSALPGSNVPASKIDGAGTHVQYQSAIAGASTWFWTGPYGNIFMYGIHADGNGPTERQVIRAEEAWNIDVKLDDGFPASGKLLTFRQGVRPNCVTTDDPDTSEYFVSNTAARACNFIYITGF